MQNYKSNNLTKLKEMELKVKVALDVCLRRTKEIDDLIVEDE